MLAILLLQAAVPQSAVEAERAFNTMAQTKGQWTAFRAFSTPDALMFTPQPVKAHDLLKGAPDPKLTVQWWPAQSFVSCDGNVAVNTGPWVRPKGVGFFTTVWVRLGDGQFKWVYDGGDELAKPRPLPEKPLVRRAACTAAKARGVTGEPAADPAEKRESHLSPDGSLAWEWRVTGKGARTFRASLWNGKRFETVVMDEVAAPE